MTITLDGNKVEAEAALSNDGGEVELSVPNGILAIEIVPLEIKII